MKKFQGILFLVALLFLTFYTLRHVYMRFLAPTHSVLDRFERPLKDRITAAKSLDELVAMYEAADKKVQAYEKEVKKLRAQARESGHPIEMYENVDVPGYEKNPQEELNAIDEAINEWERKSRQGGEIYFYWLCGLLLAASGTLLVRRRGPWLGTGLLIGGFAEMIYWSSPTFFGSGVKESSRLLTQKTLFSLASVLLLILAAAAIGILKNNGSQNQKS